MRIAIVSDIHGNRGALEAVEADLRQTSPDLVLHGGDLADAGSSPVAVVDRLRELGWAGVGGNTDEMLFRPESLIEFASQSPKMQPLLEVIAEMAAWTRELLGAERLAWLGTLPRVHPHPPIALVHASPESPWRAPAPEASNLELESVYAQLGLPVAAYGHIHQPYIRSTSKVVVANAGSVSLSYDGDRRASYLLLDDARPTIRRVEYDVEREVKGLINSGMPHADWMVKILRSGRPQMP
jgi:predicted phosphodiesterase